MSVPGQGIVRRYFRGWQVQTGEELIASVKSAATVLRSQMPALGWDWTELQEQALRAQRRRDRNKLTAAENEQLYLDEIENPQDRIRQLEQQLSVDPTAGLGTDEGEFSTSALVHRIGPEIYDGEIFDRLRAAARSVLSSAEQTGLDARSKAILQRVVERLPASPACAELLEDLARASKNPKRMASELTSLLLRHGYAEKSDNRHIRLEAKEDFDGLGSITLAKTPSEYRGLVNTRKQIERALGIGKLGD